MTRIKQMKNQMRTEKERTGNPYSVAIGRRKESYL